MVILGLTKRVNRIYDLGPPTPQLAISLLERRNASRRHRWRVHLCFESAALRELKASHTPFQPVWTYSATEGLSPGGRVAIVNMAASATLTIRSY